MVSEPNKLWALALAGVLTEQNGARHDALGGWGPSPTTHGWCAGVLRDSWGVSCKPEFDQMVRWLVDEGHSADARATVAALGPDPLRDSPKQAIARAYRAEIQRVGLLAWDAGRLVAVTGWGVWAGYIDEESAWRAVLAIAARVQKAYDSWRAYGQAYGMGRMYWSSGAPNPRTDAAFAKLYNDPYSPWNRLPWQVDLGVTVLDPFGPAKTRFRKSVCPTCGGQKTRPSITAYVYCDYCGSLADYDFQKACETPVERPGPVYEALNAQLMPALEATKARGDVHGHRALQMQLFDTYVSVCKNAVPPRVGDPGYRHKYVAYMAEGATAMSFDAVAQQHAANVARAVGGLAFVSAGPGVIKVAPQGFHAMCEAFFAQQDHLHRLYESRGVYAMQPDGAAPELQQRIGMSMFVQGWLPMLDDASAATLLARTHLASAYVEVEPPKSDQASCASCGADVAVFSGAKRVVCEKCGHRLEVGGARLSCQGCGAPLAPEEGTTTVACPHCRATMQRVQMMAPG